MKRKNTIIIFVTVILAVLVFSGCSSKEVSMNNTKISVEVSFNPLKEFAYAIGKDKIEVNTIVPDGTEPHDFEPKARDLMNINKAQLFVYNGLGMEGWVDKVTNVITNKALIIVDASKGCDIIKGNAKSQELGQYDPHIWLSLKEAKTQSFNIKEALVKLDPNNKEFYSKNYRTFAAQLEDTYNEYNKKFSILENKNFVTGHAAFGYLCRDFGLKQNSIEDVFAEGEPSAKTLKNLVEYCKLNNIKTVFTESLVSPRISETLAGEVGARVEKIYTIESKEDNKDYLQSMRYNLDKIYECLK